MERADINSVLMQMRTIKSQVQNASPAIPAAPDVMNAGGVQAADRTGFGEILKTAIDGVSELQGSANKLATAYEQGDRTIDLPQVMIAAEKASVSFEAMTQVRNRLVSAYEDVMSMPL